MPRLTDINEITGTLSGDFLIHIVDPNDTTDSPEGTSYRSTLYQLNSIVDNNLYEVGTGDNSTQRIGVGNTASGNFSATLGGSGNTTSPSAQYATIVGGRDNSLTGEYNFIGGGQDNSNFTINWSSIVGGLGNTQQGAYSFIGGGENNIIFSGPGTFSNRSSILGGSDNRVEGSNIHIIGSGITGSTDDTTYVNKFNIGTLATGTSVNNLGIDSSGNVIVGSSSLGGGGSTDYVSEVALVGNDLNFIGVGTAFNGTVDLSPLTTSKPQLFIYGGSDPTWKTLNGHGIGMFAPLGSTNNGALSYTLEIPLAVSVGDNITWKTRVVESAGDFNGFTGMRLRWGAANYILGSSGVFIIPHQGISSYGPPHIVDLEINMIKFENLGDIRYRLEIKQINYYVEELVNPSRYHIANETPNNLGLPLFVSTFKTIVVDSYADLNFPTEELKWEFEYNGGSGFGIEFSYSKLITG